MLALFINLVSYIFYECSYVFLKVIYEKWNLYLGWLKGHLNHDKTLHFIELLYYWLHVNKNVENFVQKCYIYRANKR